MIARPLWREGSRKESGGRWEAESEVHVKYVFVLVCRRVDHNPPCTTEMTEATEVAE